MMRLIMIHKEQAAKSLFAARNGEKIDNSFYLITVKWKWRVYGMFLLSNELAFYEKILKMLIIYTSWKSHFPVYTFV